MRRVPPLVILLSLLLAAPAAAKPRDRDGDKLPDRWERKHDLKVGKRSGKGDPDKDGLRNRAEFKAGTDPRDRDSDDDGVRDGEEIIGVIKSVDGGILVVKLARGGVLSGTVDPDALDCDWDDEDGEDADEEDFEDADEDSADEEGGESAEEDFSDEQLALADEFDSEFAEEFGDELDEEFEEEDCGIDELFAGDRIAGASYEDGVFTEIELED